MLAEKDVGVIGENELEPVVSPYRPDWVPVTGTTLRMVGVVFDAVRIVGERGPEVADALGREAGPIVHQAIGESRMYFLVPPRSVRGYRWPYPAEAFSRGDARYSYIGVPALRAGSGTWPLVWRSAPTESAPFVDVRLLNATVRSLWRADIP